MVGAHCRGQGFQHDWAPSKADRFTVCGQVKQPVLGLTDKGIGRVLRLYES